MSKNKYYKPPPKSGKSRTEVEGQRIFTRIAFRNSSEGGVLVEITGSQGSGKTSVMLSFANYFSKNYPNERVYWSNTYDAPIQVLKLEDDDYCILVQKGAGITFHDRDKKLKRIYPNVIEFDGFNDLYQKTELGKVNCVFFGDRIKWMDFIHYLRSTGEWSSIFIDEMSEIASGYSCGNDWKKIGQFATDLKEVRKCLMNVVTNTQSVSDVDHRIRTKVMIKIFLPGSRADSHSRIEQTALDNLHEDKVNGNSAYIEYSGKFGLIEFSDIFKPRKHRNWEAKVNFKKTGGKE